MAEMEIMISAANLSFNIHYLKEKKKQQQQQQEIKKKNSEVLLNISRRTMYN